jgi:hypothetical protein
MARLAEGFIRGSAAEGQYLDYTRAAARRLDELVDLFLQSAPREEVVHSMIMAMGAYLGKVVVRAGRARWGYDEGASGGTRVSARLAILGIPDEQGGGSYPPRSRDGHHNVSRRLPARRCDRGVGFGALSDSNLWAATVAGVIAFGIAVPAHQRYQVTQRERAMSGTVAEATAHRTERRTARPKDLRHPSGSARGRRSVCGPGAEGEPAGGGEHG